MSRAETAAEAYARAKKDLDAIFVQARRLLDDHSERAGQAEWRWDYVGDLLHYAARMREIFQIETDGGGP